MGRGCPGKAGRVTREARKRWQAQCEAPWVPAGEIWVLMLCPPRHVRAGWWWEQQHQVVLSCCPALCPPGCLPGSLRGPDDRAVGLHDLLAAGTGVFELLGFSSVVKVAPHCLQILGDAEAAVMLADNLRAQTAHCCVPAVCWGRACSQELVVLTGGSQGGWHGARRHGWHSTGWRRGTWCGMQREWGLERCSAGLELWGTRRAPGAHREPGDGRGKREYRQVAGEYPGGGENVGQAAPRRQGKERKRAAGTATHLHDVELGQQVAVSQRELVAVEEAALGGSEVGLTGQLMLQGCAQVLIQLQQGLQQVPLQRCGAAAVCSQGCRQPPASTVPAPLSPGLGWRCLCPRTARHGVPPSSSPSS